MYRMPLYGHYFVLLPPPPPGCTSCAGSTISYRRPMQHGHAQQERALSSATVSSPTLLLFAPVSDQALSDHDDSFASEATTIGAFCCLARSSSAASACFALPDFPGEPVGAMNSAAAAVSCVP